MSEPRYFIVNPENAPSYGSPADAIKAAKELINKTTDHDTTLVIVKETAEVAAAWEPTIKVRHVSYPRTKKGDAAPNTTDTVKVEVAAMPTLASPSSPEPLAVPLDARCFIDNKIAVKAVQLDGETKYLCVDHASNA